MDLALKGRRAVVGGASQGIGYAIARLLAREGARVAMVARRGEPLEAAAKRIAECAARIEEAEKLPGFDLLAEALEQRLLDKLTPWLMSVHRMAAQAERQTAAAASLLLNQKVRNRAQ